MARKLNIKNKAVLRNEHRLILTDSRTGKIKQKARAYNIVLNRAIEQLFKNMQTSSNFNYWNPWHDNTTRGCFGQTHVGGGSGELDPGRDALFSLTDRRTNDPFDIHEERDVPRVATTRIVIWGPHELQNTNITEVGLGTASDVGLTTHALIKDNDGNPVIIEKGEHDVLTIYSKVITQLHHNYGEYFAFTSGPSISGADGNWFLEWLGAGGAPSFGGSDPGDHYLVARTGRSMDPPHYTDSAVKDPIWNDSYMLRDGYIELDHVQQTAKYHFIVPAGESNERINEIGMEARMNRYSSTPQPRSIFRLIAPCPGVWEGFEIEEEFIDQGDGSQTEYSTAWAPIVEGSETIRVDGVALTKDTDYNINYETGAITFNTAPGDGLDIEADYEVEFIPKDENHVLHFTATFTYACGTA